MDINLFFEKMVSVLNLGNITEGPLKVTGGLTHRMFKVFTDQGKYIVKLLNPNIMKRTTAMENFNRADSIEKLLKKHGIEAIYSLEFHNRKMQELDGQYFYIYEWYDGKPLKSHEITNYHCEEMGKVLARIHNIDFQYKNMEVKEKNIDFEYYIHLAKEKNSPIYEMIYDKLDILNESMNKGNIAIHKLPNVLAICHNDLDSKNVMWFHNEYKIIDLECLGYSNPYLELYEIALCWSGYENCDIQFDLFKTFLKAYFHDSKLNANIDWENIYDANNGRLEWLEFNIKRALLIDCDEKEEQELGINEVRETIEHVVYYQKVKDDILYHLKNL